MKLFIVLLLIITFSCATNKRHKTSTHTESLSISDTLTRDSIMKFPARPDLGFNFEYFIYLPKGAKVNSLTYLIVETTNTGLNDTIGFHEMKARHAASKSSVGNYVSKKLKIPLLVPVFPRSATNWEYYTHALDRDAFLSKQFGIERLDLQLLAMINDSKRKLAAMNITLNSKFHITGFSASGTFANRFSILHPEKIQAMAAGGINAIAILPVKTLQGKPMNYPLGIHDINELTGNEVNLKAFRKLPKLLFMGALDDNDAVAFDDAYSKAERDIVYELMGKDMKVRWKFIRDSYLNNGISADFRTYPDIGHGTDLKINSDIVDFFRKHSE